MRRCGGVVSCGISVITWAASGPSCIPRITAGWSTRTFTLQSRYRPPPTDTAAIIAGGSGTAVSDTGAAGASDTSGSAGGSGAAVTPTQEKPVRSQAQDPYRCRWYET